MLLLNELRCFLTTRETLQWLSDRADTYDDPTFPSCRHASSLSLQAEVKQVQIRLADALKTSLDEPPLPTRCEAIPHRSA